MARTAKTIAIEYDGDTIVSITEVDHKPTSEDTVSTFKVEAQDEAVTYLKAHGVYYANGVTIAKRVRERFIRNAMTELSEALDATLPVVPAPKSSTDVLASYLSEVLALMADGMTQEEAIASVMA